MGRLVLADRAKVAGRLALVVLVRARVAIQAPALPTIWLALAYWTVPFDPAEAVMAHIAPAAPGAHSQAVPVAREGPDARLSPLFASCVVSAQTSALSSS